MNKFYLLVLFSVLLGFAVKFFVLEVFTVPTDSMEPTIKTGSKVWLNKIKLGSYKRGDIIGFQHGSENFVKRVVGMPRDYLIWEGKDYAAGVGAIHTQDEETAPENLRIHVRSVLRI